MRNVMMMVAVVAAIATPMAALALDLAAARAQGAVCEQTDGFVRAVSAAGDVKALVAEVNARRKAEYTRISKENGQTVAVVGQLAVPQILAGGAKACR